MRAGSALAALIERRWSARTVTRPDGTTKLCDLVFHLDGEPIGSFRKTWRSACKKAGVPGLLFHDLRRSGVRNLIRSGVSQTVAMSLSGHRSAEVFTRYDTRTKNQPDRLNHTSTAQSGDSR